MEMLEALSQTFDHATKIVSGVSNDQLDSPTPCSEWPLRTLLSHMTGVVVNMGRGAGGSELLPSIEGFVIEPDDLGTQFRTEADRTLAAWRTRGDDDEVNVGAGPMPARVAARHQPARHRDALLGCCALHRTGRELARRSGERRARVRTPNRVG